MNDTGNGSGRRIRRILTVIALLGVIVLVALYSTVRMERGAPSVLDENDDRERGMPTPVGDPSLSTEEDEYEDVPPGTADEGFDETWLEDSGGVELTPNPSTSTEEDDETPQEDTGEDDDEN